MSSRGNSQDQKNGILTQFPFYEGILLEEQGSVGKSAFDNVDSLKSVSLGEVFSSDRNPRSQDVCLFVWYYAKEVSTREAS